MFYEDKAVIENNWQSRRKSVTQSYRACKMAASCFSSPEGLHSGDWVLSDLHLKHQVSIAEYTSNRHLFSWGNTKEVQHHA